MPKEVDIEDYRFLSREKGEEFDHFSYPITNGVWLEKRHSDVITAHENTRSIVKKHGYHQEVGDFSLLLFTIRNKVLFWDFLLRFIKKQKQQ